MRSILAAAVLATFLTPLVAFAAAVPSTPLRFGDTSPQVILLQQALNASSDTQVAASGPGSPGQESMYFGSLTLAAAKRFQAKWNLPTTGYVGPLTLAVLAKAVSPAATSSVSAPQSSTTASSSRSVLSYAQPSEASAIDLYVVSMRREGQAEGRSAAELDAIEATVRAQATTTLSATQRFWADQETQYREHHTLIYATLHALADLVLPEKARAALGLPFGGYVALVLPICTCTPAVQQLFVMLPQATPTSNLTLNYIDGTEAFQWYNLPEPGVAVLGTYVPAAPACWLVIPHGCIPIPAAGVIEPMTGSSAVPAIF